MSRQKDTAEDNRPLTVYYPDDNDNMKDLISFVNSRNAAWLRYKLTFVPISAGFELNLANNTFVRAFSMEHQKRKSTLGYVIYENRTRLKPEFRGQDIPALIRSGVSRDNLNEVYRANLFAYCLDAYDITDGAKQIQDCQHAIMDTTFIKKEDRTDDTHFSLDEALYFCKNAGIKNVYGAHLSSRYNFNEVVKDRPDVKFVSPYMVNYL
jgi:ribonuclease BN (tRNA processing enzyme)